MTKKNRVFNPHKQNNSVFINHARIKRQQLINECKVYSSWDDSKTEHYTKVVTMMLHKFNPNHIDNNKEPKYKVEQDKCGYHGKPLNTFGEDYRGYAEGFLSIGDFVSDD